MALWRPYIDDSSKSNDDSYQKVNRVKIPIGVHEKNIVMSAYEASSSQGWGATLKKVQETIDEVPLSSRLVEYYLEKDSAIAIRRLKRIVRDEMKHEALARANSNDGSQEKPRPQKNTIAETSTRILNDKMRYAVKRTPEQRKLGKIAEFVENTSDKSDEETEPKRKKSLKEVTYEAQEAHKSMCAQATQSMDIMTKVLHKLDKKLDEL